MIMTVKAHVRRVLAGALATCIFSATSAAAESPSASTSGASSASPELEEIVVTADRKNSYSADLVQAGSFRGARQLDTPLTVSVIPLEVIDSQQAQGLLDALRNSAGVTSSQTAPSVYSNIAIRGINVENRGNYRLNGSLPIVNLVDLPLEDKDRVEALKGASALYYGFTTPSGIINLTMKRPTEDPFVSTKVFGNDHGALGGHVDMGGTYGKFGARVNLVYGSVDSGIDNTRGHRDLESGAFDFKPTDNLTFSLDAEHILKEVNEPGVYRFINTVPPPTVGNLYPSVPLPPLLDPTTNFGPDWGNNRAEETNLLASANWKISPAWALTVSGGTSRLRRDRHMMTIEPTNYVTGEGIVRMGAQIGAVFKNTNSRAEIAGTFNTFGLTHQLLIGASQNTRDSFNPPTVQNCSGAANTPALGPCTQNIYNPRPIPQVADPLRTGTRARIDDVGYYLFDRIKVTSWLDVLGGVRKSDYRELSLDTDTDTFDAKPTSISYGAVVKPKEWFSIYATYIEGLETTPGAPSTATNVGVQLPATDSKQKEAGIKIEPFKGMLLQAAYFDIDKGQAYVNGSNLYVAGGRASFQGTELSITGEITPDFSVYGSALFLDAVTDQGQPTVITTNPMTGVVTVSPTAVGLRVENTPKRTFSLAAEYRLSALVNGLAISAGSYYVGDRAENQYNQAFAPSYVLFDVGGSFNTSLYEHETTFRLNGENIANKRYFVSTGSFLLAQGGPRTIKFSVETKF